jgi:hypothetical protein
MAKATAPTTDTAAGFDSVTGLPLPADQVDTVPADDTAQDTAAASGFPGDASTDTGLYVISVAPAGVVPSLAMCTRDQAEASRAAYLNPDAGFGYGPDDIKVYSLGSSVVDFGA